MKKLLSIALLAGMLTISTPAFAAGTTGKVTPKSVAAGLVSLLVWPGIGQAINEQKGDKVVTHALLGLTGVFRFWSCYDGWVDRNGGYWDGRI